MILRAILAVDMAGFTTSFLEDGHKVTVERVLELRRDALAAIAEHGGALHRLVADNAFAVFDAPADALAAADQLRRANLRACAAIGWGRFEQADGDLFGLEMNHLCCLAEEHAKAGEILLTEAACAELGRRTHVSTLHKFRTLRWASV